MSPERDSSFDQRFRDALGGYEAPYDSSDWSAMQERLDAPARRRRRAAWIALPSLAALTALGVWWFAQPDWSAVPAYPNGSARHEAARESAEAPVQPAEPGWVQIPASKPELEGQTAVSAGERPEAAGAVGSASASAANPAPADAAQVGSASAANPALADAAQVGTASAANSALADAAQVGSAPANSSKARSNPAAARNTSAGQPADQGTADERAFAAPSPALPPALKTAQRAALFPLDPIAAHSDWAGPDDRGHTWIETDPTLPRDKRLSGWALSGALGGNAEYTGAGDGIRPGWDASLGAELWFRSGVLLQAGLRYGHYHFLQSQVGCGNPVAHGLKEPVHCPDAMLGDQARWEVPVQAGYVWDLARQRGRLRVFGGLTLQKVRSESYEVEFHQPQPGVLLYYEPVAIALIGPPPEVVTFDAAGLVESSSQYTAQVVGSEDRLLPSSLNMAAELGLGYEQFLGPSVSLGAEPHFGVPFQRLDMGGARAYYGGVTARLRWYPGLSR
jgi:hypothetical protein